MVSPETNRSSISPNQKAQLDAVRAELRAEAEREIHRKTKTELANLNTQSQSPRSELYFPDAARHSEFDTDPNYFSQNFKYTSETLAPGVRVKHDVGVDFYVIQKNDTIFGIRQKLAKIPKYQYLSEPEYSQKMYGFNIRPEKLLAEMLIPIPLESRNREIRDKQFANYCQLAIEEMQTDKIYGARLQKLLQKFSAKKLVELMLSVAKQESGGRPLGQFVFSRWEDAEHIRAFSFSIFHIVMRGSGLAARKNINCTEGQCYHPQNAAKLFLAFLFEKAGARSLENYLPTSESSPTRLEKFACFYNGKKWKKYNPNYVRNIKKNLRAAQIFLRGAPENKSTELARFSPIGRNSLFRAVLNANAKNGENILKTDKNALILARKLEQYLQKNYESPVFPTDEITLSLDEKGVHLIFRRDGKEAIIRI